MQHMQAGQDKLWQTGLLGPDYQDLMFLIGRP